MIIVWCVFVILDAHLLLPWNQYKCYYLFVSWSKNRWRGHESRDLKPILIMATAVGHIGEFKTNSCVVNIVSTKCLLAHLTLYTIYYSL